MNRLWARYVAADPTLAPILRWPWPDVPWEAVIQAKKAFPVDRQALVSALLRQNASFLAEDPVLRASIEALGRSETFSVVTGQQVGWLTGPLYTLIKAVHVVQLARQLTSWSQGRYAFVPVFWLASEDHDAHEVSSVEIGWGHRLSYGGYFQGPVGRHRIEKAFPEEAYTLPLQSFWRVGETWEGAFRACMQDLFRGTGLIWVSGDDPVLKRLAAPLWIQEIQELRARSAHTLSLSLFRAIGEKPRLYPRAINLFWLGDRERRYPTEGEYRLS
ncbi:MAG: bacillithiol biosynthesis cysteine-adding enzyme BshC, partial [Bacteroidia bacterium]|nr:bacillithiol biosynthesis cysteine-adding enzyme BshC [Bacteroidia bacterium]